MLHVYNTLNRKKEKFIPYNKNNVSMYVCGVTVYDLCHVGHARAYVVFDVIRKYLEYTGYTVNYIQNFTDVDDKIINRAKDKELDPLQLAKSMITAYHQDMDSLNIKRASCYPTVSGHIDEIIDFIKGLVDNDHAYVAAGDVYFEIDKFLEYGKLSKRNIDEMKIRARVEVNNLKRSPLDFALWKSAKKREIYWNSPWGNGRPAWHIECSAMSKKYLGEFFDIHGGGQDLIFPHHENEIAQSEALNYKPMAKYWIHNGFVRVNKEKMSKSLGNFFTLRDVLKLYDPMVIRLFFLQTHYRMPINYSDKVLQENKTALARLNDIFSKKNKYIDNKKIDDNLLLNLEDQFKESMDDDFNTPRALAVIFQLVKIINKSKNKSAFNLFKKLCLILGIIYLEDGSAQVPDEIKQLAKQRWQAKNNKDWLQADGLRDELKAKGYIVKDSKGQYEIQSI